MNKPVICLMGPTASGKTGLAMALAQTLPVEIISVDSAMIYRGMDIGTAKPTPAELKAAPHYLVDILDPIDSYCAGDFCQQARELIERIHQAGRIPLLVGGTMMYFHALQQGLSTLPQADAVLRAELTAQAKQLGWANMHARLAELDPITAARIHPNDPQRIQRALEIYYVSGQPMSALLNQIQADKPWRYLNVLLLPQDRALLHQNIAARFQQMLAQGFLHEAEHLFKIWPLTLTHPALRCVGYRQAWAYLHQEIDYSTFCDKALAATRQLAKRQLTWLRHWPSGVTFHQPDFDRIQTYLINNF